MNNEVLGRHPSGGKIDAIAKLSRASIVIYPESIKKIKNESANTKNRVTYSSTYEHVTM